MFSSESFRILPFTFKSLIYLNLCGLWGRGPYLFICKLRSHISSQRRVQCNDSCAELGEIRQISKNSAVRINSSEKISIHFVILCVSFGWIVPRHISIWCPVGVDQLQKQALFLMLAYSHSLRKGPPKLMLGLGPWLALAHRAVADA